MPIDRGEIDSQLRDIGESDRWWENQEFRDLPHVLHKDERIRGIVTGRVFVSSRESLRPRRWLVIATDQRIICLRRERFGRKQVDILSSQITALRQTTRLSSVQIRIDTIHRRYRIRVPKMEAFRFAAAIGPLMPNPSAPVLPPDLEPLAWIPGITTVATLPGVAGVISKISMLSPPEYASRQHLERLEGNLEQLQNEVERLQQQVTFLESLLQRRVEEEVLQRRIESSAHSVPD